MFASRPKFARLLAAGLPICLLWAFTSCVSLCSEHMAKANATHTSFAPGLCAAQASDDWHCPFAEVDSQSVLTQRQHFAPSQGTSPLVTACAPPEQSASYTPARRVNSFSLPSYADPPFESLRILRI
jgi:hypothetical protein